jgi:hypothetical protein
MISQKAPGAKVAEAFNTTFAGTLVEGQVAGQPLDVFVASDDEDAKAVLRRLAEDGGPRVLDAGPLAIARQVEGAGYLHMTIQGELGTAYGSALKILPKRLTTRLRRPGSPGRRRAARRVRRRRAGAPSGAGGGSRVPRRC